MSDSEPVAAERSLSRDEILSRLRLLLQEILDLESTDAISPETRLREELHIDSLGMLDVVIGVEEAFGLKVSSDVNLFEGVVTVGDAITLIERAGATAEPRP